MSECRGAAERFMAKDLDGWDGLPPECRAEAINAWFPEVAGLGYGTLGRDGFDYQFLAVVIDAFPQPVRLYHRDGVLAVIRAEYWTIDPAQGAATLDRLGAPTTRRDLIWRHQVLPGAEWVYAARGLAMGVLSTGAIVTAAGFVPCPAATYARRYATPEPTNELPQRRDPPG